jgi:hypothetical protein
MAWEDWVNVAAWKAASHHLTGALPIMAGVYCIAWVLQYMFVEPEVKVILNYVEEGVLVTIFGILGWRLIQRIWRDGNGTPSFLMAS